MGVATRTTAVGAFVLGALILAIGAVVVFGGGRLFEERIRYVVYFDGSVTGLNVGSPVTFRGVKVGSVSDIQVTIGNGEQLIRLPVFVHINPRRFAGMPTGIGGTQNARQFLSRLVNRGLRAQLVMPSLVTGQLAVDLDFYPDRPAEYSGVVQDVPELPAIPSDLEVLTKSLKQLPLEQIVNRALNTLQGIDELIHSPQLPETLKSFGSATTELDALLKKLNAEADPLLGEIRAAVTEAKELAASARQRIELLGADAQKLAAECRKVLASVEGASDRLATTFGDAGVAAKEAFQQARATLDIEHGAPRQLVADLEATAEAVRKTLATADSALARIDRTLAEESPLRGEALRALREISEAARSFEILAEYLQRHPEALLRGKGKAGER